MKTSEIAQFFVAGLVFSEVDLSVLKLKKGQKVDLVLEPENDFDPEAIRIEANGKKLGYVPAEGRIEDVDKLRDAIAENEPVRVEVKQFCKTNPTHRMILLRALVKETKTPKALHRVRCF